MPIDPKDVVWDEEAPKSESKAPPSDIQWDEEPDPYIETAAGFGRGLAKGVAAAPGIFGDIHEIAKAAPWAPKRSLYDALMEKAGISGLPTSAQTTEAAKPAVRALSEKSETLPGKFAETVGEFAAMPGAGKTPAQIVSRTVLPAVGSEVAGQVTEGTALEPYARFAGAMLGSPAAATIPKMAERFEQGQRIGVDLPYFVTSESGVPKAMAQVSKAIPIGGGAVTEASQKAVGQMGKAMEDIHNVLGAGTAETSGSTAKSGILDWIQGRSKNNVTKAYDAVDAHINPTVQIPLTNLSSRVQEITNERAAANLPPESNAINLVLPAATNPNGLTYEGIKKLRTHVGEMLDTGILPPDTDRTELKRLYGALSNDLEASVNASGGPRAKQLFQRANSYNAAVSERREQLAKIVGLKGDVAPEQVLGRIQRMAQAGTKGDINSLIRARKAVPPHDWDHVTSGIVESMGRTPEGMFSPDRFVTGFGKMSEDGKNVMFGPKGNPVRDALEDINGVSSQMKELGQYTNVSKTANVQQAAQLFTTILAAPFFPHAAAGAAASIPANFMMAKALSSPLTARAAANLQKAIYNAKVGMAPAEIGEQRIRAAAQAYIDAVGKVTGEEQKTEERTERKAGGRVDKRDYPAKRLTRLERAAKKAFNEIAHETKPLMDVPDEHIVEALDQVK